MSLTLPRAVTEIIHEFHFIDTTNVMKYTEKLLSSDNSCKLKLKQKGECSGNYPNVWIFTQNVSTRMFSRFDTDVLTHTRARTHTSVTNGQTGSICLAFTALQRQIQKLLVGVTEFSGRSPMGPMGEVPLERFERKPPEN